MSEFPSFSRLNNLCFMDEPGLVIHTAVNGHLAVSTFQLWITLLWTLMCKYLIAALFQFVWMYTQKWVIWKFYVHFLKKLSYCFSQLKYVSSFNGKKKLWLCVIWGMLIRLCLEQVHSCIFLIQEQWYLFLSAVEEQALMIQGYDVCHLTLQRKFLGVILNSSF